MRICDASGYNARMSYSRDLHCIFIVSSWYILRLQTIISAHVSSRHSAIEASAGSAIGDCAFPDEASRGTSNEVIKIVCLDAVADYKPIKRDFTIGLI